MSRSIYILKKEANLSVEKVLNQFTKIAERIGVYITEPEEYEKKKMETDGYEGNLASNNIENMSNQEREKYKDVIMFYIYNQKLVKDYGAIDPQAGEYLYRAVAFSGNGGDKVLLRFLIQYFEENHEDYLWDVDNERLFSAQEVEKYRNKPYKDGWMYLDADTL